MAYCTYRRIRREIAFLFTAHLLLVCMAVDVEAGPIKVWQLKETAAAPVLLVGRIISVQKNERVPDGLLSWKAETVSMTAEVEVLRYTGSGERAINRLHVHFLAYGPSVTGFMNGYPPPLPKLETGQVLILPLQENKSPGSEWRLTADSGADLTIPARAEMTDSGPPPTNARVFIVREIANALSRGTPREVSAISHYLSGQYEDLTGRCRRPCHWRGPAALGGSGYKSPGLARHPSPKRSGSPLVESRTERLAWTPELVSGGGGATKTERLC